MIHVTRHLCAVLALLCALTSHAAIKSTKVDPPTVVMKRGSSTVQTFATMDACEIAKPAVIKADGEARVSGSAVYDCILTYRTRIAFGPNPPAPLTCTTPKPAQEAQIAQCPAGSVGTWSQTRDYATATYPTCWSLGEWTPATPPAGICATPQTLVYACSEAGADGRILESATVQWPNCPTARLMAPSKALVVAVNTGTLPHYWRLASKLTDERIWAQISGVGAWTRVSAIDWEAVLPPTGTGSVTLGWTPPTENTDGTALVNLAGHRILYGTSASDLSRTITIPGAGVSSYVIEGLAPATWYFGVRAYTASGAESANSNVASKAIP